MAKLFALLDVFGRIRRTERRVLTIELIVYGSKWPEMIYTWYEF